MSLRKRMYRGGHPNRLASILNRRWAIIHSLGISPNYLGKEGEGVVDFVLDEPV